MSRCTGRLSRPAAVWTNWDITLVLGGSPSASPCCYGMPGKQAQAGRLWAGCCSGQWWRGFQEERDTEGPSSTGLGQREVGRLVLCHGPPALGWLGQLHRPWQGRMAPQSRTRPGAGKSGSLSWVSCSLMSPRPSSPRHEGDANGATVGSRGVSLTPPLARMWAPRLVPFQAPAGLSALTPPTLPPQQEATLLSCLCAGLLAPNNPSPFPHFIPGPEG